MVNWFNYKTLLVLTIPLFLGFGEKDVSKVKWGFFGHKRINRIATFTLPPEMFGFYKDHIEYLTEHAVDPINDAMRLMEKHNDIILTLIIMLNTAKILLI